MVHLEALEMLSKQCQLRLQSTLLAHSGEALIDLQETLSEVKQLCELPEESEDEEVLSDEEFANKISEYVKNLHKSVTCNKLIEVCMCIVYCLHLFSIKCSENISLFNCLLK